MKFWGTNKKTLLQTYRIPGAGKYSSAGAIDYIYFFDSLIKYGMIFYPQERTEMICFAGSQSMCITLKASRRKHREKNIGKCFRFYYFPHVYCGCMGSTGAGYGTKQVL